MSEFKGINPEILFLLAENRFRDSKPFYEEHKEKLKQGITLPMRELAGIIGEELLSLDPLLNTVPWKMVSRIRRDTRYTKDKSLYRENVWIMFMRDKHKWHNYPCFWFEVTPSNYSMGVGFFGDDSGLYRVFRKNLREKTEEFLKCAKKCEKTGAALFGKEYKRAMPDCPKGLEKYYNRKDFGYILFSNTLSDLKDDTILDIIRKNFKAFSPMYSFMLDVSDEFFSKEDE